jgi:hypothetical protein
MEKMNELQAQPSVFYPGMPMYSTVFNAIPPEFTSHNYSTLSDKLPNRQQSSSK